MRCSVIVLLFTILPASLGAQTLYTALPRFISVTGGAGNALGWFGGQGEYYLADGRVSMFVGLGYTPRFEQGDARGVTFAGGLRGFTAGEKHRAFLEGSVSQLVLETGLFGPGRRLYGPGVQGGYQFVSRGGFTFMASVGVGYAPGVSQRAQGWAGLLGFAAGYTWRRTTARDLRPMR